ncbi:adenylate/guanylate cyclase domain-containing protein [Nocardioides zeae]|uniref:Adenylate/guanylate cyclase domain-containing protein n=1 Tax=Nocardioides imazamoxiresistens TaxID=3231893 RepID=A0ABU3PWK4_9ACTN|nr:adenylate/guanylate cyclase domain-containing protein [Nocardioides zeae]MDT9593217.1 adenylate/guanylate cyclase domain-containing protein [Nocardioides zeae]
MTAAPGGAEGAGGAEGPGDVPLAPERLAIDGDGARAVVRSVEVGLLGGEPSLTRRQVADRVGVPFTLAEELWHRLGFAHHDEDDVAFTEADVEALSLARDLVMLGILDAESQAALVRTWGRSFARLAEWQVDLLARLALDSEEPGARVVELTEEILPRLEVLQSYVWRRHLVSAANRMLTPTVADPAGARPGEGPVPLAVGFVDIVGYTSRSRQLTEAELVAWVEEFEDAATTVVVDRGARVIKTIGDEILYVTDDPVQAAEIALVLTDRGSDPDDPFPAVRAGVAYGGVVTRLGDVYGATVNVAARLTSIARPGTVVVDQGLQNVLVGLATPPEDEDPDEAEDDHQDEDGLDEEAQDGGPAGHLRDDLRRFADDLTDEAYQRAREALSMLTGEESPEHLPYRFRRIRRANVKGYPGLRGRVLRRA